MRPTHELVREFLDSYTNDLSETENQKHRDRLNFEVFCEIRDLLSQLTLNEKDE